MPIYRDPFDAVLNLAGGLAAPGLGSESPAGAWSPPVDVFETDAALFIKVELPGVLPEEIRVEAQAGRLAIAGNRSRAESARRYHHLERMAGPFRRDFTLPTTIAADQIEASYQDGVLEIRLPKLQQKRSRQIKVNAT